MRLVNGKTTASNFIKLSNGHQSSVKYGYSCGNISSDHIILRRHFDYQSVGVERLFLSPKRESFHLGKSWDMMLRYFNCCFCHFRHVEEQIFRSCAIFISSCHHWQTDWLTVSELPMRCRARFIVLPRNRCHQRYYILYLLVYIPLVRPLTLRTNENNPLLISISFHGITPFRFERTAKQKKIAAPLPMPSAVQNTETHTVNRALSELQCKQRTRGETAKDPPLRLITTTTVKPRRRNRRHHGWRRLRRDHRRDHGQMWRAASCDGVVRGAWCSSSLPLHCCSTICCWPSLVST